MGPIESMQINASSTTDNAADADWSITVCFQDAICRILMQEVSTRVQSLSHVVSCWLHALRTML